MVGVVRCFLLEGGKFNNAEAALLRVVCGVEHKVLTGAEKDNREAGIVLSTAFFNLEIISWHNIKVNLA